MPKPPLDHARSSLIRKDMAKNESAETPAQNAVNRKVCLKVDALLFRTGALLRSAKNSKDFALTKQADGLADRLGCRLFDEGL